MWGIFEIGTTIHILPMDEQDQHEFSSTCKCEPRVEIFENSIQIIHDAFDGRVAVERVNEILGI
jgi:hypothetical protein